MVRYSSLLLPTTTYKKSPRCRFSPSNTHKTIKHVTRRNILHCLQPPLLFKDLLTTLITHAIHNHPTAAINNHHCSFSVSDLVWFHNFKTLTASKQLTIPRGHSVGTLASHNRSTQNPSPPSYHRTTTTTTTITNISFFPCSSFSLLASLALWFTITDTLASQFGVFVVFFVLCGLKKEVANCGIFIAGLTEAKFTSQITRED